jgi:signal transduction histidine kinase
MERNELEAQIEHLRAELAQAREAVRARDNFIAVVAHELRNPMTPMIAQVQRLLTKMRRLGGPENPLLREVEFLDRAVDYYYRRATALLEISRVTTGLLRLQPTTVDLSGIVRNAVLRYALLAERAGTRIDENIETEVAGTMDQMAVEQIIDNILSNAIRYGDTKPIEVTLRTDGELARISVQDHGPGISIEDQARVFERFEQAIEGTSKGGFGIGLWLARQLVEAMSGAIGIQSRPGAGAVFTVDLPLRKPSTSLEREDSA